MEKSTCITLISVCIVSILDFIIVPIKNKNEEKVKEKTAISCPIEPTPIKKENPTVLQIDTKTVAKKQPKQTVTTTTTAKKTKSSTDGYLAFFSEHADPSFYSDSLLVSMFNDINRIYFNNFIKVQSISFVDFNKIPGSYDKSLTYNGETHFIEDKGLFIVISDKLKDDLDMLKSTIAHEMIHAYIDLKYIQGNPSELEKTFYKDQNLNHKGIFKEIEDSLNKRGLMTNKNYVHVYDETYLDKKLAKK